jgi:hypothetical protein
VKQHLLRQVLFFAEKTMKIPESEDPQRQIAGTTLYFPPKLC